VGDRVIVKSGLVRGDRVVIDGVMKVATGQRVTVSMPLLEGPALAGAAPTGTTSGLRVKSIE
jgi:hypothetical protein